MVISSMIPRSTVKTITTTRRIMTTTTTIISPRLRPRADGIRSSTTMTTTSFVLPPLAHPSTALLWVREHNSLLPWSLSFSSDQRLGFFRFWTRLLDRPILSLLLFGEVVLEDPSLFHSVHRLYFWDFWEVMLVDGCIRFFKDGSYVCVWSMLCFVTFLSRDGGCEGKGWVMDQLGLLIFGYRRLRHDDDNEISWTT